MFSDDVGLQDFRAAFERSGLESRGGDGSRIDQISNSEIGGHALFSVTGEMPILQPFHLRSSTLLFNGEIYNYQCLAGEHRLEIAGSDTVLLGRLIEKIGFEEAISKLDGAFAILYLDHSSGTIWLARDRWGQKPLFFASLDDCLCVSSSFRFVEDLLGKKRHRENIAVYQLFGFSPFDTTLNPNVKKVEPGTIIRIKKGEGKIWKKRLPPPEVSLDIDDAISASMRQTIPLKSFCLAFSGGIDSSYIFAVANINGRDMPVLHLAIQKNQAESENARRITDYFDTELMEVEPLESFTTLKEISTLYDHPVLNTGILATASIAYHARRKGYRVLITGMGGDEYFGGYNRSRLICGLHGLRLTSSLGEAWKLTKNMPWKVMAMILCVYLLLRSPAQRLIYIFLIVRSSQSRRSLLRLLLSTRRFISTHSRTLQAMRGDRVVENVALFERHYVMTEFMAAPLDMVAQSFGVEVRSPFFGNALDAQFESDPARLYGTGKKDLVEFLERHTPFKRSKKQRFNVL